MRNAEFSKALAKVLWRPYIPLGPPDSLLELVLGEVAQVITRGQRVMPARAQALGYAFRDPDSPPPSAPVRPRPGPAQARADPAARVLIIITSVPSTSIDE